MSDHVVQSYHDSDGKAEQSMRSSQSVWMAHWTRTSCNAAPQNHNHFSRPFGNKEDDRSAEQRQLMNGSDISRSAKGFQEVESRTFEIMNESLTMGSKNMINEGSGFQPFPAVNPFQQSVFPTASHIVPHRFNSAAPPFMRGQEEIKQLSSAILVCEKKIDKCSNFGNFVNPYIKQNNANLLPNIPSMTNTHSPVFGGEQYLINHSGKLFTSQSSPPEMLHNVRPSLQGLPQSVHDVEHTRVCTSVDSVGGLAEAPPIFSQTTRSLLITEKTDVNLCEENQIFRESRVSTRGNTVGGLYSHSPLFGHGRSGVKLQPLGSSTDSEGEENVKDAKAFKVLKNESSAETDTMDMDSIKEENHLFGENSSSSNKVITTDSKLLSQATIHSPGEEVGYRQSITKLPDMNLEPPALPVAANSTDNTEPSTSKTQSLDMELLVRAEQQSNSKSNHSQDGPLDPSSRWIKRLRLSTPKSALGTKSSDLGEASSHEKVNKSFSKIMKGRIGGLEQTLVEPDQTAVLLRNSGLVNKGSDITLSHFWIQRWRHSGVETSQDKAEAMVVCEPKICSKVGLEDFQKKQFPSIAAMALMGKAMTGFQPCDIQKRESFVVWNSRVSEM